MPRAPRTIADSSLPPDPEGRNAERAAWAHQTVTAFRQASRVDEEDAMCDLLADLMHW